MPLKVLLADDSMTAQNMGKKILVDAGYQVIAVSNGAQAMKKLASEKPDLVLLDVYMPGYTGLEICERIKSAPESANTPVILCVAKMEPFKQEEGTRVKADAVIIKPFEATDLVARMQEMQDKLARWRASQAEVEDSVSRFEQAEAEPVEEESARERIEVPEEMAAAPAFAVEFESESAPDLSKFSGEFVVEHERQPVDISGSSHMVAADGLSGVFEMQQPAAQNADVQEFEIAAPVASEPELEIERHGSAENTPEPSVAPDPGIERFAADEPGTADAATSNVGPRKPDLASSAELHNGSESDHAKLRVEVEAEAAAEVEPRSEFVVERISIPVSDSAPEPVELSPLPAEPDVTAPEVVELAPLPSESAGTVESVEPAPLPGSATSYSPHVAEIQAESSVAVAEETTTDFAQALNWVAEEVALDPNERTASLEEEMRALLAETQEQPEAAPQFEVGESEITASAQAEESITSAEGQVVSAPEPPKNDSVEQAAAGEVIAAESQMQAAPTWPSADSLRCEAEPVIEAVPESAPLVEADASAPAAVEPNPLASAMAAAIAGSLATGETSAATDPNTVEQAVDRLLDRLKPDLVSQILRELNKK